MKFLIDAQLPPRLCAWLAARGHEAVHVAQLGMDAADDSEVLSYAIRNDRIVVTKDEDFWHVHKPDMFALLWLRCGNASNRALLTWLDARWARIEAMLLAGERLVEVR